MGWTSPLVLTAHRAAALVVLVIFCVIETRVAEPMFQLALFRIRAFTAGNLASLLSGLGRGGLMFILIIWLQGIWLPRSTATASAETPLWAGIYMLPLTVGLPDRRAAVRLRCPTASAPGRSPPAAWSWPRPRSLLLELLPVNFAYWQFAADPAAQRHRHGPVRRRPTGPAS